ncbi:recombinase family protein [Rummeliibacillus stabekisii]|uniref:recombinase family protein n=1 Tax=Rummeliibacillus stabekisii TaxID=241244 RepID=UPI00371BF468
MKVGIYLRKSRAEDGIQDLEKHKEYLLAVANKNNWSYELYEEIDSSQDINRPELQRLRKDIQLKKIDAVMVVAVDRLTRKSRHFFEIIEDYFVAEGMTTLYIRDTPNDLTDATVIAMLQIQATFSQAEYSFIVKRLNEGRKSSVKKGTITGKLVYGYVKDKETNKPTIQPDEAIVVRKMADMLLQGETYYTVIDTLNKEGFRTRKGNLWEVYNVKSVIHSPIIRGHVIQNWQDEKIERYNNHEAIITEAEYAKIKEILEQRADHYKGVSTAPTHYLQGLLKCPKCKKVMVFASSKPKKYKNGVPFYLDEYVYYVRACRPIRKDGKSCTCGNNGVQATAVEILIKQILKEFQSTVLERLEVLKETDGKEVKDSKRSVINNIKKEIDKLTTKEDALLDLLIDKTIDKTAYDKKTLQIKEQRAELISKLHEAEQAYSAVDIEQEYKHVNNINSLIEQWDDLSLTQKRKTIQITFKHIEYSRFDKSKPPQLRAVPYGEDEEASAE